MDEEKTNNILPQTSEDENYSVVEARVIQPNSFINGDCMGFMRTCPPNFFDLAIVDPQYGIGESGQRNVSGDRPTVKWSKPVSQIYKPFDDSRPPDKEYFEQLFRISKNQIIFGGNYFTEYLRPSMCWILWDKKVAEGEHLSAFEMAWTSFSRKAMKFEYLWAGFKKAEQIKRVHPTQKPEALYRWILRNFGRAGDLILDTHVGSASSLIACTELGYDYVGFEIDKEYYEMAKSRLGRATRKYELFEAV